MVLGDRSYLETAGNGNVIGKNSWYNWKRRINWQRHESSTVPRTSHFLYIRKSPSPQGLRHLAGQDLTQTIVPYLDPIVRRVDYNVAWLSETGRGKSEIEQHLPIFPSTFLAAKTLIFSRLFVIPRISHLVLVKAHPACEIRSAVLASQNP